MKNIFLKQLLKITSTALVFAAFSIAVPASALPSPDDIVGGQMIETPGMEDEDGDNGEPGISPMSDIDDEDKALEHLN